MFSMVFFRVFILFFVSLKSQSFVNKLLNMSVITNCNLLSVIFSSNIGLSGNICWSYISA